MLLHAPIQQSTHGGLDLRPNESWPVNEWQTDADKAPFRGEGAGPFGVCEGRVPSHTQNARYTKTTKPTSVSAFGGNVRPTIVKERECSRLNIQPSRPGRLDLLVHVHALERKRVNLAAKQVRRRPWGGESLRVCCPGR